MRRPNIIYINSHDTGRFVEPYGHQIATPRLADLARDGVLFRRAFSAAPTCSPSRAALLTGQAAHTCGMLGLAHLGWSLTDPGQHLLHTLSQAGGYHTVLAGLQHVARGTGDQVEDAASLGYDIVLPRADAEIHAADFLRSAPRDRPFYLEVGFFETHRMGKVGGGAFNPDGAQGIGSYGPVPAVLPDTRQIRDDLADFGVAAARLDRKIGVVLDALAESGLEDDTVVICTTDHGIPFPGMKCDLTDHGIGVMLILRGPGGLTGGRVIDALVSQIDLFPTVCELAALDAPGWLQGRSLMPLIRGESEVVRDEIFAEVTHHAEYEPQRAVRTERWKYIRRFDHGGHPRLRNCDASPSKRLWVDHGWPAQPVAAEAMYDLVFDPQERNNLVADPALTPVLEDLRGRLNRWMRDTTDPLLPHEARPEPEQARA